MGDDRTSGTQMLIDALATGAGAALNFYGAKVAFQAHGAVSSSTGAATIKIQGCNIAADSADALWLDLGTISLTLGTTQTTDGFVVDAPWRYIRANVTAISGADATVSVYAGVEV
jgi:hypothetical protein